MLISTTPRVQLRRSVMSFDCTKHINPMALMSIYSFMGATHCLQWIQINSISKLFIIHTALKYHSFGKFLFYNWFYTIVRSQRKAVIGPLQLFKERPKWRCKGYRVKSSHSPAHNPLRELCSAGVTVRPWLGFWVAGNVSIQALLLWDGVKQISTVRLWS